VKRLRNREEVSHLTQLELVLHIYEKEYQLWPFQILDGIKRLTLLWMWRSNDLWGL
jgi:hypothetical protein